jgi:hypothetical protein
MNFRNIFGEKYFQCLFTEERKYQYFPHLNNDHTSNLKHTKTKRTRINTYTHHVCIQQNIPLLKVINIHIIIKNIHILSQE